MQAHSVRWWITPPGPDEPLASVLSRAGALYHAPPAALWRELEEKTGAALGPIEAPTSAGLWALAQALGVPAQSLRALRMPDGPEWLAPRHRGAVCLECQHEQAVLEETPQDCRYWARALAVSCLRHGTPLRLGHTPHAWGHHAGTGTLGVREKAIVTLVDRVASVLDACEFGQGTWPAAWAGDAPRARRALGRLLLTSGTQRGPAPIASVFVWPQLRPIIHAPQHWAEPGGDGWHVFRSTADPAVRRAALWVVGWQVMPGLDAELAPGRVPLEL